MRASLLTGRTSGRTSGPPAPTGTWSKAEAEGLADLLEAAARVLRELGRTCPAGREQARVNGAGDAASGVLLDASQVQARTGLSRGQVYRLAAEGGLGVVRVGAKALRFDEGLLEAWVRNGGCSR